MPTNQEIISPPKDTINENHTKDPSISLSIGISTLSLKPHKMGIKAIKVIIALITCKPKDSTILANL